jgi:hypothetical protein
MSYVGYIPSSDDLGICWCVWRCEFSSIFRSWLKKRGWLYVTRMNLYISHFLDGVLILRYIKKMGTNGGGGVADGVPLRRLQAILVPGWSPNLVFFSLIFVQIHTYRFIIRTFFIQIVSLYRPAPWTKFCPRFAPKMGTYVSREFSLTTEFTRTYVRTMYCEISVQAKWREIQKSPKPPTMVFLMGSHRGASLCRHVVHHSRSY